MKVKLKIMESVKFPALSAVFYLSVACSGVKFPALSAVFYLSVACSGAELNFLLYFFYLGCNDSQYIILLKAVLLYPQGQVHVHLYLLFLH